MKIASSKPWRIEIDKEYRPKITVIIPTYNESEVIGFKLRNLAKIYYPKSLMQVIVADSNSTDGTLKIVDEFAGKHPEINLITVTEEKRTGKSAVLNLALRESEGDVIIVSDADSFWPSDILNKSLPFLADSKVAAISGPKTLLNKNQSWITTIENHYLESMNMIKLGQSKTKSTLLFEGGFSAYKKKIIDKFDPYDTGSDDCGSLIDIIKNDYRAIFVPYAKFFTVFPISWREQISIKIRRSNQLLRIFSKYWSLLINGQVKSSKSVILLNLLIYFVSPLAFIPFLLSSLLLLMKFQFLALFFLVLFIPKIGIAVFETIQAYFILLISLFMVALNRKFIVWKKPQSRRLVTEDLLRQEMLI